MLSKTLTSVSLVVALVAAPSAFASGMGGMGGSGLGSRGFSSSDGRSLALGVGGFSRDDSRLERAVTAPAGAQALRVDADDVRRVNTSPSGVASSVRVDSDDARRVTTVPSTSAVVRVEARRGGRDFR